MLAGRDVAKISSGAQGFSTARDTTLMPMADSSAFMILLASTTPRIGDNVKYNWTLFYDVICGKKVPVVLVVTGLEYEEDMDAWCDRKDIRYSFGDRGIHFSAMAGITATRGKVRSNGTYVYQEYYPGCHEILQTSASFILKGDWEYRLQHFVLACESIKVHPRQEHHWLFCSKGAVLHHRRKSLNLVELGKQKSLTLDRGIL
jgi:hypothetical protein